MTPGERKELRARLLVRLYEATDGDRRRSAYPKDFAADVDPAERERAMQWLRDSDLAQGSSIAGDQELTARGIDEAERLLEIPEEPSDTDLLEGDGVHVLVLSPEAIAAVEALLGAIDRADLPSRLEGDELASFEADRRSVGAQVTSPTPRKRTIRDGIRNLLRPVRAFGVEISAKVIQNSLHLD